MFDFGVGCVGLPDADVVADRAIEQAGILKDDGDGLAQRTQRTRAMRARRLAIARVGPRRRREIVVDLPDPVVLTTRWSRRRLP